MFTFAYPDNPTPEEKKAAKELFGALKFMLPCNECRQHFAKMFDEDKPINNHLKSQESLSKWLVDCHNCVNERKRKPKITYEEASKEYGGFLNTCAADKKKLKSECKKNFVVGWMLGSVMILLLISAVYYIMIIRKIK